MNLPLEKKSNKVISKMKGTALISIVSAHTAIGNSQTLIGELSVKLLATLGVFGVIVFFFLSGYVYANDTKTLRQFWVRKFNTLIIPWLFIGTIVYYISALGGSLKEAITIKEWFYFIIGQGSYLYFVPVLLICYLITYSTRNNNYLMIINIIISLISIILTGLAVLSIYPFLNIFNWLGYFSLGVLAYNNRKKLGLINEMYIQNKFVLVNYALKFVIVLSFLITYFNDKKINYWSFYPLIFAYTIILFCYQNIKSNSKLTFLGRIGDNSLSLYLMHMPVAGIVNIMLKDFNYIIILKPIIVYVITISIIKIITQVSYKFTFGYYMRILFGVR